MRKTTLNVGPGSLLEYEEWLKSARHGDMLIYWIGDLQYDRQVETDEDDLSQEELRKRIGSLNVVATRIRNDARAGTVLLTQKRLGPSRYEYRAMRRRAIVEDGGGERKRSGHGFVPA